MSRCLLVLVFFLSCTPLPERRLDHISFDIGYYRYDSDRSELFITKPGVEPRLLNYEFTTAEQRRLLHLIDSVDFWNVPDREVVDLSLPPEDQIKHYLKVQCGSRSNTVEWIPTASDFRVAAILQAVHEIIHTASS
jgi:hypothetical protein